MHDSRIALSPQGLSGATTALLVALLSACGSSPSAGGGTGGPPPASGAAGSAGTAGATIPAGASGGSTASGGAAGSVAASTGGSSPGHTGGSAGTGTGGAAGNGGAATGGGAGRATGGGGAAGAGGAGGDAAACPLHGSLPATSWAVRLANAVLARSPDPANLTTAGWEYNHGIVLRGMQQVWSPHCDPQIRRLHPEVRRRVRQRGRHGNIPAAHSFDNIQPSVLLPFLFQQTGSPSTTPPPIRFAPVTTRSRPTPTAASGTSRRTRTRCGSTASTWASRSSPATARCSAPAAPSARHGLQADAAAGRARARSGDRACFITPGTTARPARRPPGPIRRPGARRSSGIARSAGTRWPGRHAAGPAGGRQPRQLALDPDRARSRAAGDSGSGDRAVVRGGRPRGPQRRLGRELGQRDVRLRAEGRGRTRYLDASYPAVATRGGRGCRRSSPSTAAVCRPSRGPCKA